MTSAEARERVARGAALLDEKRPGWAQQIDRQGLVLSSCSECVLGQLFRREGALSLFRGYDAGSDALDLDGRSAETHGFNLSVEDSTRPGWKLLRAAWIDAINERRAPRVSWTWRIQPHAEALDLEVSTE